MNGSLRIMALNSALFVIINLGRSRRKSHISLEGGSVVPDNVTQGYRLLTALAKRLTIINKLKGLVGTVANPKWLLLHLPIDLIVTDNVWLRIIRIGLLQKIIGIGKVALPRNKAVIIYMRDIRLGGKQFSRGMVILAESVRQIKVVYSLLIISRNERIIPNFCLM